jgi:protein-S-isoprenylcysteine O-methyltransferase Ste14
MGPAMTDRVQELLDNRALRRALVHLRYALVVLLLFPVGWWMQPERLPLAIGVSVVGQAIQTWCFASLIKNRELSIRGPYLLSRNPMYVGRYFLLLGFVLLLGRGWTTVLWVMLFTAGYALYVVPRVRREERRLLRVFRDRYEDYLRRVPRFRPTLRNATDPHVRYWDWNAFRENNAHWNLLALLAYPALLLIHHHLPRPW